MRRVLSLALIGAALLLAAGGELDTPDVLIRRKVEIPAGATGWMRVDVPPSLLAFLRTDTDDLRLVDDAGEEVERLTVATGDASPARAELSEFARERVAGGGHVVGVLLPGPGRVPARLRLVGGAGDAGPVTITAGVRPDELSPLVTDVAPRVDGADRVLDLPPFVGRLLRVSDDAGRRVLAEWDPAPEAREELVPQVVQHAATARGVEIMLDLRVRHAPRLVLEVDVETDGAGRIVVVDGNHPDAQVWRPLPFAPSATAPPGRLQGRVVVPEGYALRWIRLIVPCEQPGAARLVSVRADVPARRLWFRAPESGGVRLLAGLTDPDPPSYPLARCSAGWDFGTRVGLEPVPWAPAIGPVGVSRESLPPGRPTPWAEIVSTLLLIGFLAAWLRTRAAGG